MNHTKKFVHGDVIKFFPWLKPRTIISWSERGLLKPDFGEASGRGSSRVYSFSNLIEIGILSELLNVGMPFSAIKAIMKSPKVKDMIDNKQFDKVIILQREANWALMHSLNGVDKSTPWTPLYDTANVDDFFKDCSAYKNSTSLIVVNVQNIKSYINQRVNIFGSVGY